MSFKPEVSTDGGQTFNQNALAFATEAEALASAKDLFHRWMLCTDYRAVESAEPVNYALEDGVLKSAEVAA
jgi:hypothetical protein